MKSLYAALVFAVVLLGGTSPAPAASQGAPVAQAASPPPADFGSPPSGEIPILYNDRHVYANPDLLKQGRVLAAYARNGGIYVPLRSMFEQMGATVSYDPATKIATISKPGAEVVVTVGKPEVVVNGESRPLDVPPIVYHGVVLVPIRVISEGHGRLRAVGARQASRGGALRRSDAAADRGSAAAGSRSDGRTAASAAADSEPTDARRILPLVLLHAAERVE